MKSGSIFAAPLAGTVLEKSKKSSQNDPRVESLLN